MTGTTNAAEALPPTVDDVLATYSLASAEKVCPTSSIPDDVQQRHRVQVSIRGQRFEMAMGVALTYSLALRFFFTIPMMDKKVGGESSAPTCVWGVVAGSAATNTAADELSRSLYAHYSNVVAPHLAAALGALHDSKPSPVIIPEEIHYDASAHLWQFVFARRLPAAAEAVEAKRLQDRKKALVSRGENVAEDMGSTDGIYEVDPNGNPFLLLQSHYMGVILVFLRRTHALYKQSNSNKAEYPQLPIRWHELSFDLQLSLVQIVRALGITPLLADFGATTANIQGSVYALDDVAESSAPAAAATNVPPSTPPTTTDTRRSQQDDDDDDDGVDMSWVRQGCHMCGLSGHSADKCPHIVNNK